MTHQILQTFRSHPEVAVFLAISLGVLIGRVKFFGFQLGSTAGALLMGLVIGQLGLEVPSILKSVFFALFIYSVGFKSGPEFFGSLNRGTLKLVAISVIICGTGLATIIAVNLYFHFDPGMAAGLGAGALTDTAILGTASSTIAQLNADVATKELMNSNMAIAYAITYLFGTIGLVIFVGTVAPMLLGVDLKALARELEAELGVNDSTGNDSIGVPYSRVVCRSYSVAADRAVIGRSIKDIEQGEFSMSIERIIRDDKIIERDPALIIQQGDILGVYALRSAIAQLNARIGPELDHPDAMSFPTRDVEVTLTASELAGQTISAIAQKLGTLRHGVLLRGITRQGMAVPLLPKTELRRGDIISLTGRPASVDALVTRLGKTRPTNFKSDIAIHTLGMVIGSLVGMLSAHIGIFPIELGTGGGILVTALAIGWFNSRNPQIGALPPAAQWAFSEFGLTAFAAVVGLLAGPQAITAIQQHGASIFVSGVLVTLIPPIVALYVGRYVLGLNPLILFGAIAGAQTEAASMNRIIEESGSSTPVIGFTVCYAVSNVLLAVCGPIIVSAIAHQSGM